MNSWMIIVPHHPEINQVFVDVRNSHGTLVGFIEIIRGSLGRRPMSDETGMFEEPKRMGEDYER